MKIEYAFRGQFFKNEEEALRAWLKQDEWVRRSYGISKYRAGELVSHFEPKIARDDMKEGTTIISRGINRHIVAAYRVCKVDGVKVLID